MSRRVSILRGLGKRHEDEPSDKFFDCYMCGKRSKTFVCIMCESKNISTHRAACVRHSINNPFESSGSQTRLF